MVRREVRSYISEYVTQATIDADFEDLAPIEAAVIDPVRTLAEKLALLHHAATAAGMGTTVSLERAGRHFGDIASLLRDDDVQASLARPESTIAVLAADVDEWSAKSGWTFTARPDGGDGTSVAFEGAGDVFAIAQASYSDATSLMWGDVLSFEECLEVVAVHAHLL